GAGLVLEVVGVELAPAAAACAALGALAPLVLALAGFDASASNAKLRTALARARAGLAMHQARYRAARAARRRRIDADASAGALARPPLDGLQALADAPVGAASRKPPERPEHDTRGHPRRMPPTGNCRVSIHRSPNPRMAARDIEG